VGKAVIDYLFANKEWLFSGVGVAVVIAIVSIVKSRREKRAASAERPSVANPFVGTDDNLQVAKDRTRILFIDDDVTFPVVKILKHAGWMHTKIVKDIRSLDDPDVQTTDIFFVDIQGVGKALQFADQGLGLARALKQKYPDKWLVIYSAEPKGDTFHQAFRIADDRISKTADPYEFQTIVETFASSRI
jgi:hypothetical protein